jgi:hypothetical protein
MRLQLQMLRLVWTLSQLLLLLLLLLLLSLLCLAPHNLKRLTQVCAKPAPSPGPLLQAPA